MRFGFDVARCIDYARRVSPRIEVLLLSARSGGGMEQRYHWIERRTTAAGG